MTSVLLYVFIPLSFLRNMKANVRKNFLVRALKHSTRVKQIMKELCIVKKKFSLFCFIGQCYVCAKFRSCL